MECPTSDEHSHWGHDVVATLNQRQWRWFNVATTSCPQWVSLAFGQRFTCAGLINKMLNFKPKFSVYSWSSGFFFEKTSFFIVILKIISTVSDSNFLPLLHKIYHSLHDIIMSYTEIAIIVDYTLIITLVDTARSIIINVKLIIYIDIILSYPDIIFLWYTMWSQSNYLTIGVLRIVIYCIYDQECLENCW